MEYQGRRVLASKRNIHGVRVYIPEKISMAGISYTAPCKFSGHRPVPRFTTLYSMGACLEIPIRFNAVEIIVTDPFSKKSIQSILNYAVGQLTKQRTKSNVYDQQYSAEQCTKSNVYDQQYSAEQCTKSNVYDQQYSAEQFHNIINGG